MTKYIVEVTRSYTYRVPTEAQNEQHARELVRGLDVEEIEQYESNAFWDFEFGEEVTE
jgi:hypothetical protein